MSQDLSILIIDDEPEIRNEIEESLEGQKYTVFQAGHPSEAFEILANHVIDICILDIRLPDMDGFEVLEKINVDYPLIETIIISGHGDMDMVINALRIGAVDFLNKPFSLKELDRIFIKIRKFHIHRTKLITTSDFPTIISQMEKRLGFKVIGESVQWKELVSQMVNIAGANHANVLITGESGTGKELVAKGIHLLSPRKDKPFYPVNCAAIPEELVESEFFGHAKGAFTGAVERKIGWFEKADKSTLFMDEIGDMKFTAQPKFLRILNNMHFTPVGSTKAISVDVRIIAATNQDLQQLVRKQLFRSDLYYRLNAFTLHIAPLRERCDDINPLFCHFLNEYSQAICKPIHHVDPKVLEWLYDYNFPGNVRELKHMVERAIIICGENTITLNHFIRTGRFSESRAGNTSSSPLTLQELEIQIILQTLKKAKYVKVQAAKLLNISRQALDRKIAKYGIKVDWK